MSCQPTLQNLAFYLQGVTVETSSNLTSDYFVTASLPSAAVDRRVWQFITQGLITGPGTATFTLDYTAASEKCPDFNITFEGALNGTLTVHNQVFSANKFVSYEVTSTYVLVLTIRIPKAILQCYGDNTTRSYSLDVYINDKASSYTNCTTYTGTDSSSGTVYTCLPLLTPSGGSVTLLNSSATVSATIYYLCVGGGGGGGKAGSAPGASGGGGGYVSIGTFLLDASQSVSCNYFVGAGGKGGVQGSRGGITELLVFEGANLIADVSGGGGGGGAEGFGLGGDSGFDSSDTTIQYLGGQGQDSCSIPSAGFGGGGAGASQSGGAGSCSGTAGYGGNGYQWIDGNYYGGGGGGSGTGTGGSGGEGGGGDGAATDGVSSCSGGTSPLGGGGGASGEGQITACDGGSGICILAWESTADVTFTDCT